MFNRKSFLSTIVLCLCLALTVNGIWSLIQTGELPKSLPGLNFDSKEDNTEENVQPEQPQARIKKAALVEKPKPVVDTIPPKPVEKKPIFGEVEEGKIRLAVGKFTSTKNIDMKIYFLECELSQCSLTLFGDYDNTHVAALMRTLQNAEWNQNMNVDLCKDTIRVMNGKRTAYLCLSYTKNKIDFPPLKANEAKAKPVEVIKPKTKPEPIAKPIFRSKVHAQEIRSYIEKLNSENVFANKIFIQEILCAALFCKVIIDNTNPQATDSIIQYLNTLEWNKNKLAYLWGFRGKKDPGDPPTIQINIYTYTTDLYKLDISMYPAPVKFRYQKASPETRNKVRKKVVMFLLKEIAALEATNSIKKIACKESICRLDFSFKNPGDAAYLPGIFAKHGWKKAMYHVDSITNSDGDNEFSTTVYIEK